MGYRHGEGDVTHPLAAHLLLGNLHITSVADDSAVADSLVLAAVALVVLGRTENLLAEESVPFRLVGPVVDGLRLEDLAAGTCGDVLRRSERDAYRLEVALYFVVFAIESRHITIRSNNYSNVTLSPRPRSSWSRTLSDSGIPAGGMGSPFTMAS